MAREHYPDYFGKLAELVGCTPGELRRAIIDVSMRDWRRELKRQLRRLRELQDEDDFTIFD